MKALVTTALALVALALTVPAAGAEPDSYQPQLSTVDSSDVVSRYLDNARPPAGAPTDAVDRAVANRQGNVPQDAFDRAPLADRPLSTIPVTSATGSDGSGGLAGLALIGALLLAAVAGAASAAVLQPFGRRTPAHR